MAVVTLHMINDDVGAKTLKTRPGDVFTLGAYIFPKTGNAGGGTVKLQLICTSTIASPPAPTTLTVYSGAPGTTGAWAYITGNATIPAGYDTVDPVLTLNSIPVTDFIYTDDLLVRETTAAQNVLDQIYQSIFGGSSVNNSLASLGTQFQNWLNTLFGQTTLPNGGALTSTAIPGLSASKIISGVFPQSMVTGLAAFYNALTGAGTAGSIMPDFQTIIDNLNKMVTGSATTGQAVTTWLTNLQSWANNLWGATTLQSTITPAVVPNLSGSKITSPIPTGSLPAAIPSTNIPALGGLYAPNLVLNPDFESTALWVGATGAQTALQAHSGTKSWQLQGAG